MSHFQLGTLTVGCSGMQDLDAILYESQADPSPVTYQPYTEVSGQDNLGHNIKSGNPVAHWHFEWLSQPDVSRLMAYEGYVCVRTEVRTGTIREFKTFYGYMQEPEIGEPILPEGGVPFHPQARGPIDVDFISLILVP